MITESELLKLLKDLESDRVEKTISLEKTEKFGEAICAFANDMPKHEKPGYLIVGVEDNGNLNGTKITEQNLQTLLGFRNDGRIVPPPAIIVNRFQFPEGDIAVVEVQPSLQPPVRFNGKICIRIGQRRGVATEQEERILTEKRSSFARSFDTWPCQGSKVTDLSIDTFKLTYLPNAIDKETLEANHRDLIEQLASLKFFDLKADCPTFAGLLLFGLDVTFYLPGAYIQYLKIKGLKLSDEIDSEKQFSGDLLSVLKSLEDFIKVVVIEDRPVPETILRERNVYNYPFIAIRESLMNAIMHRDYQSNAPIRLYEFSNRIEIHNPGGLFGQARPENFPRVNDYRNPTIAEAMKNLGYVNRFSRGVARIKDDLMKNGSPEPEFIFNENTNFAVIIYKKQE